MDQVIHNITYITEHPNTSYIVMNSDDVVTKINKLMSALKQEEKDKLKQAKKDHEKRPKPNWLSKIFGGTARHADIYYYIKINIRDRHEEKRKHGVDAC